MFTRYVAQRYASTKTQCIRTQHIVQDIYVMCKTVFRRDESSRPYGFNETVRKKYGEFRLLTPSTGAKFTDDSVGITTGTDATDGLLLCQLLREYGPFYIVDLFHASFMMDSKC